MKLKEIKGQKLIAETPSNILIQQLTDIQNNYINKYIIKTSDDVFGVFSGDFELVTNKQLISSTVQKGYTLAFLTSSKGYSELAFTSGKTIILDAIGTVHIGWFIFNSITGASKLIEGPSLVIDGSIQIPLFISSKQVDIQDAINKLSQTNLDILREVIISVSTSVWNKTDNHEPWSLLLASVYSMLSIPTKIKLVRYITAYILQGGTYA